MNKFKSLILGTAAAAIASTGVMAADAPMGREPVYRCDVTGFIELPGTDVCFKVGGWARLVVWAKDDDAAEPSGDGVLGGDDFGMTTEARLNFDARRSTDHGTVRAFIEMNATNNDGNTGGGFNLRHGFAQLGNWVFGKTWGTYLHLASDPNGTWLSPIAHTIRIDQIRYTHQVGNGLTVSVALEDHAYEDTTNVGNGGSGENNVPSIVMAINYANGGWDSQLSGVVRFNEYSNGTDETGFGVMFATAGEITDSLNLVFKANYTKNAPSYAFDWQNGISFGPGSSTNFGDDVEQFGVMGGVSGSLNDRTTWQLAGMWGDTDSTGSSFPITATQVLDRQVYGVGGLIQYQAASGFDFIGELIWVNTDPDAADTAFAAGEQDELYFFGQARARF